MRNGDLTYAVMPHAVVVTAVSQIVAAVSRIVTAVSQIVTAVSQIFALCMIVR